jgi:hypothetical protein
MKKNGKRKKNKKKIKTKSLCIYEDVPKSFRTGRLEWEL